jgi:hypothetical protein
MYYAIYGKNLTAALITEDGVVLHATENFDWACGKRIGPVLGFVKRHSLSWRVSDSPPPGLVVREGVAQLTH